MSGLIDLVYSAAQDSDFLLYPGMGEIMYDLRADGSFHAVSLERDVLGKRVGSHDFSKWERWQFIVWSASCGCDYVDNPAKGMGLQRLYDLVSSNLNLSQEDLITAVASKAGNPTEYRVDLLAAVLSFSHHVVFKLDDQGIVRQEHLTRLPSGQAFTVFESLTPEQCKGVWRGELHPKTLAPRLVVDEFDDANESAFAADFSTGRPPESFSVQRLKAWLIERGIPVPSQMARRHEILDLVKKALDYPAGTWGVITPWNSTMAGWTRPDPVTLVDDSDPIAGEVAWELMRTAPFPTIDDAFVNKLMPQTWANTLERGRKLFMDGMCYASKLSIQHGKQAGSDVPIWVVRMPVRASMRSQQYQVRVALSPRRPFLAPSSGCECENQCIACSHQVALLLVIIAAQAAPSFQAFEGSVRAFTSDTLASGAVHWWHLIFTDRKPRRRQQGAERRQAGTGLLESVQAHVLGAGSVPHPFELELMLFDDEAVAARCEPLHAPGSPAHAAYVRRLLGTGHFFSGGMLAEVVHFSSLGSSLVRETAVGGDEPLPFSRDEIRSWVTRVADELMDPPSPHASPQASPRHMEDEASPPRASPVSPASKARTPLSARLSFVVLRTPLSYLQSVRSRGTRSPDLQLESDEPEPEPRSAIPLRRPVRNRRLTRRFDQAAEIQI